MDPQAAWKDLVDACSTGDTEAIEDVVRVLLTWLDSGGFPPQTVAGRTMRPRWNRTVAYAACFSALAQCHWKKG
jgi:hypothetical protein